MNYAFAQSVLFKVYGNNLQETGHLTKGHICLTEMDRISANDGKCSLLYGELLPRGANKVSTLLSQFCGHVLLSHFLSFLTGNGIRASQCIRW